MGILDKIKSLLSNHSRESLVEKSISTSEISEFMDILEKSFVEFTEKKMHTWDLKVNLMKTYINHVKLWGNEKKVNFILFLSKEINSKENKELRYDSGSTLFQKKEINKAYVQQLFRTKLILDEESIREIYNSNVDLKKEVSWSTFRSWPLGMFLNQIYNQYNNESISSELSELLKKIKNDIEEHKSYFDKKDFAKYIEKIDSVLHKPSEENEVKSVLFLDKDDFVEFANDYIQQKPDNEKVIWYQLIKLAQKATGSKPTKKYLEEAKGLIQGLGTDKFKKSSHDLLHFVINLKEKITEHTNTYRNQEYTYQSIEFLSPLSIEALKGFVWMNSLFYDNQTIQTISKLAERSFKKIPDKGQAATAVGNACLYTLFSSKGLDGIGQLTRLRMKIKQTSTLTLIEKYIDESAKKLGISNHEIEDLAVDDFKVVNGQRAFEFDTFTCRLELVGMGKSVLRWFKEDGSEQKTVPSNVKELQTSKLKKVKDIQKQIDQTTSAQKERLDRMLRIDRKFTVSYFQEKYLDHGILSFVSKNILFNLINGEKKVPAIQRDGCWYDLNDNKVDLQDFEELSLWHPATSSTEEVRNWRQYLIEKQIQQPFKQVFREVYLLTEAELRTRTYSNRMASHILKQHQYVTLAKGRNWSATLMGCWDGGDNDIARLVIQEYNIRAEYWVDALEADDAFNATGIWNYVTTDQIRFIDLSTNTVMELIHVPVIAFSEVLRDIDLFVGVASVGNDPSWQDSGGLPAHRDYWQSYSFGDLSEVAKNRKEILQSLIPRLKIASVSHIEDKFLVVKGKIRTYKIHIGSTNILMEPNDQYLCIVADRSKKDLTQNVFLPFEGDTGLSIVLSKAFLLAADDKITDTSITSQINR